MKTLKFLLLVSFLFYSSSLILAQAGNLDTDFGNEGKVVTDIGGGDGVFYVTTQTDGKVVVTGKTGTYEISHFTVLRYNADGSLDDTFGDGGVVSTDFYGGYDIATACSIQSDGKIVVVGVVEHEDGDNYLVLVRYNVDGSLDPGFGSEGKVLMHIGPDDCFGMDLKIANDKILVSGKAYEEGGSEVVYLSRFNMDGTLDLTFATNGFATTVTEGVISGAFIDIQNDKILISSTIVGDDDEPQVHLKKFNWDGSVDTTFGDSGVFTYGSGDFDTPRVEMRPDGKITLVFGASLLFVIRLNKDGSIDTDFGPYGTGYLYVGYEDAEFTYLFLVNQADGKMLILGAADKEGIGQYDDFVLIRLNEDGSADNDFGTDGFVFTDFNNHSDIITHCRLTSDGKIIAAGISRSASGSDIVLAKYDLGLTDDIPSIFPKISGFSIYPNPIYTGSFSLKYELEQASTVDISLTGIDGKKIGSLLHADRSSGMQQEKLVLPEGLSVGNYFLNISAQEASISLEISIIRNGN